MYYTYARLLYVEPFSSLADSLVSLTPDSIVVLLLPRPYLLVCACNCMYVRMYVLYVCMYLADGEDVLSPLFLHMADCLLLI